MHLMSFKKTAECRGLYKVTQNFKARVITVDSSSQGHAFFFQTPNNNACPKTSHRANPYQNFFCVQRTYIRKRRLFVLKTYVFVWSVKVKRISSVCGGM